MDTTIRNLDESVYRRLKAKAAMEGISIGAALNQAIKAWLEEGDRKRKGISLLDIRPEPFGESDSHLSEKIDELLYAGG